MKMTIMMKVTSHQPISETPLDEERRESKGLTPGNPKEGKVPAARTPLKGQYVCHSSIVGLCRLSYRLNNQINYLSPFLLQWIQQ